MIDRDKFFSSARATVFHGRLDQDQVDGCNTILDGWQNFYPGGGDMRWLAYELGTAFHETAFTMQPVREIGNGEGRSYGVPDPVTGQIYAGRGYVQLTFKANYESMSSVVGEDLVHNPDLALRPDIAAKIMFYGMAHGSFTGVGLPRYFTPTTSDWINARRIINGTDCAAQIANYGHEFLAALTA